MTITIITVSIFSTFSGVLSFFFLGIISSRTWTWKMNMNDSLKEERHSKFTVVVSLLIPLIEQMLFNVRKNRTYTYTYAPFDECSYIGCNGIQKKENRNSWKERKPNKNQHAHTQHRIRCLVRHHSGNSFYSILFLLWGSSLLNSPFRFCFAGIWCMLSVCEWCDIANEVPWFNFVSFGMWQTQIIIANYKETDTT